MWALWPRRAGGHDSDITDSVVRGYALDLGLVDVKVAAVDEDWSGLRLVWRTANRGRVARGEEISAKFSPGRIGGDGIRGSGVGGFEPSARDK